MTDLIHFPFLTKSVSTLASQHNFEDNYEVNIQSGSKKGDGYTGEIFFVSIKDSKKTFNFVAKSSIRDVTVRDKFSIKDIYNNEIYFYGTIYPKFKKFEKEVKPIHLFKGVSKCYSYSTEADAETLCFENLKLNGFELTENTFDEDHIYLLFDRYAHLHALSFAYKDKKIEEFKNLINKIDDIFGKIDMNMFIKPIENDIKLICEYLKEKGNIEVFNKLKNYTENLIQIFEKSLRSHSDYFTIIHGDSWRNNFMFKYENRGGKLVPVDVKLLDFQVISYCSPARDLAVAFYTGASKKEFDRKDEFLQYYYKKFSQYLKDLGSEPENLFSYKALTDDWEKISKLALIFGITVIKMKETKTEELKDLTDVIKNNSEFLSGNYDKTAFQEKAIQLILHFHEHNLL